jgi:alcohol dehydrogenase (cytochrome c)
MTSLRSILVPCTLVTLVTLSLAVLPAQSSSGYSAMTESRLLNPEPHNWLMYRGNYAGWGYSPLDQITPQNVTKLTPVWTLSTGVNEGHQTPPIVNNGVMRGSRPTDTRP